MPHFAAWFPEGLVEAFSSHGWLHGQPEGAWGTKKRRCPRAWLPARVMSAFRVMRTESKILTAFLLALLVVLLIGGLTYVNSRALLRQNDRVTHTYEVLRQLDDMLSLAQDVENGSRGFLVSGNEDFLKPFNVAVERLPRDAERLRQQVSDNPEQFAAVEPLAAAIRRRADIAREFQNIRRAEGLEGVQRRSTGASRVVMDEIRRRVAAMQKVETDLLAQRTRRFQESGRNLQTAFTLLLFTAVLLLAVFYVLVRSDFAARTRAAARLAANERRFRALLESTPDALVLTGAGELITLVNPAFERLFGLPREEAVGRPLTNFLVARPVVQGTPDARDAAGRADDGAAPTTLDGGKPDQPTRPAPSSVLPPAAFEGIRRDGQRFPAEVNVSPLADVEAGDAGHANPQSIAAIRDRTEREQAEDRLRRYSEDLARSNAELERFAYVASHDLQEPLRMVSSYTQLLGRRYKGKLDASADEFIAYAVDGAVRMQTLINDLLAYSRVGSKPKEFAPVQCESVLGRVLHDLRPTLDDRGATVSHDALPTVRGDAVQIGQLFQNLLGNATKFRRPEEAPRVEVTVNRQSERWWRFCVRDNGIGIEPQYFERIFALFQRLHTKQEYPGTGIGLAICKRIVERHGGQLWVESKPGQGASFLFTLPVLKE